MQKLVELVKEYPDLPIVAMVDGGIVEDPGMMWMGSITNALISDIGLIGERYYDEREDFKAAYYDKYGEELDKRFNYDPAISFWGTRKYSEEAVEANEEANDELEAYLDMKADEYMRKAIVIYVREPDNKIFKEA
jgi:hypothetical protein